MEKRRGEGRVRGAQRKQQPQKVKAKASFILSAGFLWPTLAAVSERENT
jgi:hypothetical protein